MPPADAGEFRTTFMFGSPEETPHGWTLTIDSFLDKLRELDPDVSIHKWKLPFHDEENVSFTFSQAMNWSEGSVLGGPDGAALDNCTAAEASTFVTWLRDNIVPSGTPIEFNVREAAEAGLPNRRLPDAHDQQEVQEALLGYVRDVLAAKERGEI